MSRNQGGRWCETRLEGEEDRGWVLCSLVALETYLDFILSVLSVSESHWRVLGRKVRGSYFSEDWLLSGELGGRGLETCGEAVGGVEGRDERHPEECSTTESFTLQSTLIPGRGK